MGFSQRAMKQLTDISDRVKGELKEFVLTARRLGQEDPRRVVHAFKVGLAITIVSLFYYFQPLFNGFGISAIWAILTVVVVFEYSVGATLGKGLNRMVATLIGGMLGVLAHHLADLTGKTGEPIVLGLFGFIVTAIATFMRFIPRLKKRCDYGLSIFILTFALVAVSGYRVDEIIKMAQQRLSTIVIGSCISILICICIRPVWSGGDLHNLVAANLDKLASFLEGFGGEYFKTIDESEGKTKAEKSFLQEYKSILGSKSTDETLANLAAWEPNHGRFRFRHPWKQYLKLGALARQCAYRLDTLHKFLVSDSKVPAEIRENIREPCTKLCTELSKAMQELALGIRKMRQSPNANTHINNSKSEAKNLKSILKTREKWQKFNLIDVLPALTVASLLIDITICVENIAEAVHLLGSLAGFKPVSPEKPTHDSVTDHVVVTITENEVSDSSVVEDNKSKSSGQMSDSHISSSVVSS